MANNALLDLFSETDDLINNYLRPKEWFGTLPMQCCRIIHRNAEILAVSPEPLDLFDFCKGGKKSTWYSNHLIRFDPTVYPVPEEGDDSFGKGLLLIYSVFVIEKERAPIAQMVAITVKTADKLFVIIIIATTH